MCWAGGHTAKPLFLLQHKRKDMLKFSNSEGTPKELLEYDFQNIKFMATNKCARSIIVTADLKKMKIRLNYTELFLFKLNENLIYTYEPLQIKF
jgi:hypothetical protein